MGKTLVDIAAQIGVSTATISRVINHQKNVLPETRALVEKALKDNQYQYRARRKTSEKNTDAVLVIAGQDSNPITRAYFSGIREELGKDQKMVFLALTDYRSEVELQFLQYAETHRFSGVFLLNVVETPELVSLLGTIETPVVLVNRYLRSMDTDIVSVDNYRCGYAATDYLIQNGHVRIGHFAGPTSSITCQNRTSGYLDAMKMAGLPVEQDSVFYGDRFYQSGYEYGQYIVQMKPEERFTAVYCTAGVMAYGMYDALIDGGLKVPEDVSIICNDATEASMHHSISFTNVDGRPEMMGKAAVELLRERWSTREGPPKRIIYPPVLTVHHSVKRQKQDDTENAAG